MESADATRKKTEQTTHRPSAAATPSSELRRPLRLRVDPLSSLSSLLLAVDVDEEARVGAPVDFSSREIPLVKAASKSSKSKIHLTKEKGNSSINTRIARGDGNGHTSKVHFP